MDALDEFFATWSEPEAWCEICAERPALHVVLRDTGGKYGGATSHVRIWDPATQMRVAVCRHCCEQHVGDLGQWRQISQAKRHRPQWRLDRSSSLHWLLVQLWMHRLAMRGRALFRLCMTRW